MKTIVGIDVSKKSLDIHVIHPSGKTSEFKTGNQKKDHEAIMERVRKLAGGNPIHWCMEETAAYHWCLAIRLLQAGEFVSVENPRPIRHHGISNKAVQKTDRADARVIASFAKEKNPPMWALADPKRQALAFLDRRLDDLNKLSNQESNRLEHPGLPELVVSGILASLKEFERQIKEVEAEMERIVKQDAELSEQVALLQTIPGIGKRCALGFVAQIGDPGRYAEAQDVAAYAGLNPRLKKSGSSVNARSRVSKAGNAHLRKRLYMATVSASKHNPIIRPFYEKLASRMPSKKAALIACERKLIMIMWGILKNKTPFDPDWGLTK